MSYLIQTLSRHYDVVSSFAIQTRPLEDFKIGLNSIMLRAIRSFPFFTKPNHDLMLTSYQLFLGHHELMKRYCVDWVTTIVLRLGINQNVLPSSTIMSSGGDLLSICYTLHYLGGRNE